MKYLLLFLIFGVRFALAEAEPSKTPPSAEPGVSWTNSYVGVLAEAKKQQRLVLLDFYAGWCGWCHVMDHDVYTDPRVIKLTQDFICVKINVDDDHKTAHAYKISRLPRTIILNPNGEIVGDHSGYLDADHFVEFLKGVKR